jgi:hypothetical protein
MSLIIPVGDLGSGKTLFSVMLAKDSGIPVYSNFKLNLPNYRELTPQMLVDIDEESLIIIDEAYAWLESRLSMRDMNRYLSYILFQSRKRKLDFIITAQLLSTLDVRFRDMCNFLVLCQKMSDGFHFSIVKNSMYRYRPVELFMSWEQAQTLYPLYDTMEKIDPIDSELMSNVIAESSPEDLNREISNMAREIITKNPNKKITKGMVKDYLIQNAKPLNHAEYVYNRIQVIITALGEKKCIPNVKGLDAQ